MTGAALVRLIGDRRGISAVEFAICLPFLVLLYIGGYQLSDATSANRKVTTATRAIADLTSQYTSVSAADLDTILNASTQILAPYKVSAAKATVSQIYVNSNLVSTVSWSRGLNVSALTTGAAFALPASMKRADSYVIVANVDYSYVPVAAADMIGTLPLRDTIIMWPRASVQVKLRT
jgi:Flp pilus assembly protein TadG